MLNMRISILPKTSLGKWSTGLIIAAMLMLVVFSIGSVNVNWHEPWLVTPIILAAVFAISSMVVGVIGIVKSKERSILVFIAAALGVVALVIGVGQFLIPQ